MKRIILSITLLLCVQILNDGDFKKQKSDIIHHVMNIDTASMHIIV